MRETKANEVYSGAEPTLKRRTILTFWYLFLNEAKMTTWWWCTPDKAVFSFSINMQQLHEKQKMGSSNNTQHLNNLGLNTL